MIWMHPLCCQARFTGTHSLLLLLRPDVSRNSKNLVKITIPPTRPVGSGAPGGGVVKKDSLTARPQGAIVPSTLASHGSILWQ
jgi:hypothetical protein